jgi:hypothetical protein
MPKIIPNSIIRFERTRNILRAKGYVYHWLTDDWRINA